MFLTHFVSNFTIQFQEVAMIELFNVSKRYGDKIALHAVSLRLEPGSFTVLLGASGAGKSTLLRSINMLSPISSGTISVEGIGRIDMPEKLRALRRMTGFIFQQHQLILRQTALRNTLNGRIGYHSLLYGLLPPSKEEVRQAYKCLARVGLEDYALSQASCLSGGQQQRVGIARALMQEPKIMLADEPVASLDPQRAHEVVQLLHDICRADGICTVVSLHQVELARHFADRIIALSDGRIVFDGRPEELDEDTEHRLYATEETRQQEFSTPTTDSNGSNAIAA